MPSKRDRILALFNRSRNASPAPAIQQASSSNVGVAWEGVKTALVLLKESSDWFPPLKSATGGLLALVDATEVSETNLPLIFKPSDLNSWYPAIRRILDSSAKRSMLSLQ